jgi:hypothetical protein
MSYQIKFIVTKGTWPLTCTNMQYNTTRQNEKKLIDQLKLTSFTSYYHIICSWISRAHANILVCNQPIEVNGVMYHVVCVVPEDFDSVLRNYAEKGYRVIGLAWKPLVHGIFEDEVHSSLEDIRNVSMYVTQFNYSRILMILLRR